MRRELYNIFEIESWAVAKWFDNDIVCRFQKYWSFQKWQYFISESNTVSVWKLIKHNKSFNCIMNCYEIGVRLHFLSNTPSYMCQFKIPFLKVIGIFEYLIFSRTTILYRFGWESTLNFRTLSFHIPTQLVFVKFGKIAGNFHCKFLAIHKFSRIIFSVLKSSIHWSSTSIFPVLVFVEKLTSFLPNTAVGARCNFFGSFVQCIS